MSSESTVYLRRRGRLGTRETIVNAARAVFGHDGYARANVDAIAAHAGVSTRTIYNHFPSKEELFDRVLHESAAEVAAAFDARVSRLDDADLDARLVGLGLALVAQRTDFPEHFAMVHQIQSEARHVPERVLADWQEAGPHRVTQRVVDEIERLGRECHLRVDDPERVALHFITLATFEYATRSVHGTVAIGRRRTVAYVTAGVRAFLDGYAGE